MPSPYIQPVHTGRHELRRSHTAADGVDRADLGLRKFPTRIGDAVMCRECGGDGVVLAGRYIRDKIKKCLTCNGEGLEPK